MVVKKKRKLVQKSLETCPSCNFDEKLRISKSRAGIAFCDSCHFQEAIPVGKVMSQGKEKGKEVYLLSSLMWQHNLNRYRKDELDDAIDDPDILVINDMRQMADDKRRS